ncbi:hypothetical protein DQ04_18331000 [Trypanosoma grayi]|uniref:hypothetical protein n=1 Tax=Trypanosoma grayi TaxID=71804 RepID=UPI0004F43CB0|nr:hypothetical protein DQ04_18331000 [Trypanosoma grayi]KEG05799.1 hypothetical protein DQ04_18331000 [Trypanosoma grayi]
MLLHHLIMLHEARERQIADGDVVDAVERIKAVSGGGGTDVHPSHYEHVLTRRECGIAATRLRELLQVARSYESADRPLGGGDPRGSERLATSTAAAAAAAAASSTTSTSATTTTTTGVSSDRDNKPSS